MSTFYKFTIIVVISMLALKVSYAKEQVLVMTDHQKFIEQVASKQGVGTISSVYNLLYEEIGVPQNLRLVPLNRQAKILEQNDYPACTLYRFKTLERENKHAFSAPIYFSLHYKLYQQMDLEPLPEKILDENGAVLSLSLVVEENPESTLLVLPNVSYGSELDMQLKMLPKRNMLEWTGVVPHNRLSDLFSKKRSDFALMFPSEVFAHQLFKPENTFRTYSISGISPYTKGYMMCNKHPDSYAYIDLVNDAISTLYGTAEYLSAHTDFYDATEVALIESIVQKSMVASAD